LILTGGTIGALGVDRTDLAWYSEARTRLEDDDVLARVPELQSAARVTHVPFRRLPAYKVGSADLRDLCRAIEDAVEGGSDGVVLVLGTDTLEEIAYALHLTVNTDRPVVLSGAMRPASALSSDGDLNLLNAVRAAASPQAVGVGVVVVFNGMISSARTVTKTSTFKVEAFRGLDYGPLGYVDADGQVVIEHRPSRPHTSQTMFTGDAWLAVPRVDVVLSHLESDGVAIDALVAAGARGIVSAGSGSGRQTPAEEDALDRAREAGVAICQASRVGSGRVVASPGLRAKGRVAAGDLLPWKARILLQLALTKATDPVAIQEIFDTY
jgi:L-asparaginase